MAPTRKCLRGRGEAAAPRSAGGPAEHALSHVAQEGDGGHGAEPGQVVEHGGGGQHAVNVVGDAGHVLAQLLPAQQLPLRRLAAGISNVPRCAAHEANGIHSAAAAHAQRVQQRQAAHVQAVRRGVEPGVQFGPHGGAQLLHIVRHIAQQLARLERAHKPGDGRHSRAPSIHTNSTGGANSPGRRSASREGHWRAVHGSSPPSRTRGRGGRWRTERGRNGARTRGADSAAAGGRPPPALAGLTPASWSACPRSTSRAPRT